MCVIALDSLLGSALDSTNLDNEDGEADGAGGGEGDGLSLVGHDGSLGLGSIIAPVKCTSKKPKRLE